MEAERRIDPTPRKKIRQLHQEGVGDEEIDAMCREFRK